MFKFGSTKIYLCRLLFIVNSSFNGLLMHITLSSRVEEDVVSNPHSGICIELIIKIGVTERREAKRLRNKADLLFISSNSAIVMQQILQTISFQFQHP